MADVTCQNGLGAACYYGALPAANDAILLVLIQLAGIQADDALRDYATLAAMLASGTGNKECTATNYARPSITSGTTVTYNQVGNYRDFGWPDRTIVGLGSNALQVVQKLIVCYQPVVGGPDFVLSQPNGSYRDAG